MNEQTKELAKKLCAGSSCHHKCPDTDKCVVEEEAELLINENKSNNFDVKSNEELFKQALVEGLNRRFDREIEEAKKIEQIEEMIEIVKPFVSGLACEEESGSCELTDCRNCNARDLSNKLYNTGYRKQSGVIDEFAEKLKEAPIKCGLPLLGLSTKEEIEEYFNGIMLQVRDAIDNIAKEMKGGE